MGNILQSTAAEPLLQIGRIGVYARDEEALAAAQRLRTVLRRTDIELRLLTCEVTEGQDDFAAPAGWKPDLVLAMGGDGTVLHTLYHHPDCPVLAINFGTVGFLTAGDDKDLSHIIFRLLEGDYFLEERTTLAVDFRGNSTDVINEVVIKGTIKMVAIEVAIDGTHVHTIRGDGVIVGTPTGSTSYLMSAGASIVVPTVDTIIVSGINEYRFSSRSLVLPGDSVVQLKLSPDTREDDALVTHDGRDRQSIGPGETVTIRRGSRRARLIFFDRHAFFRNLKERLDW